MGLFSWVAAGASAVATFVGNAAATVWQGVKTAGKAVLTWMADEGHRFVDDVKSAWATVRPYIESVVRPLMNAAEVISATIPWLHKSVKAVNRVLAAIVYIVEGPLAYAVEKAIRWTMDLAKYIVDNYIRREDMDVAERHRETISEAADTEGLDPDDAHVLDAAAMLLDFHIIRTKIADILKNGDILDFNQFLRLRAASKLLELAEQKMRAANDEAEISSEDVFIVAQTKQLISENPDIAVEDLERLDTLMERRLGKKLLPFAFQELLITWGHRIKALDQAWRDIDSDRVEQKVRFNTLKNKKKFGLTDEELADLKALETEVSDLEGDTKTALRRKLEMQKYVYAAEGFMLFLEKSEEELQAKGKDYLAEEAIEVAPIIISCAQEGRRWSTLSREEQGMVSRFAMIYEESFHHRTV